MFSFGSELLFTETLIDLMFDYIDDSNLLLNDVIDKELIFFKNKVNNLFQIKIIYEQSNKDLSAQFIKPNIIKIMIPFDNLKSITGKDLLRVFLHELSHYFTHSRVPNDLIVRRNKDNSSIQNRVRNRLLFPPSKDVSWNEKDLDLVRKFLDYIFQINELPNFALSFSLGFIDSKEDVDLFFNDNLVIINKYLQNDNKEMFYKWYDCILDNDLRLLFQIHYFVKYLGEAKYQRQLIKLKKIIKKYYRRLLAYL